MAVDYVSKWVEVEACPMNDTRTIMHCLHKHIFTRFETPRVMISNEGSHIVNKWLKWLLDKYNVKHKITTTYHPKTNRQAKLANREINNILEKVVRPNKKDWSKKLDAMLWACSNNL